MGTIMTFSDSQYFLKNGEPSLIVKYVKKYLENCEHFFNIMFTCSD